MCSKMQIYLFWPFFGTLRIIILGKGHARAQIIACLASRGTRDKLHQFEITRHRDRITLINIYVFKNCKYTCFLAFFGTLRIIILGKGHARAQIIACLASRGTRDKLHQFKITRHRDHITLINIYVFKNCKYTCFGPSLAPSGLLSWLKGMHKHNSLLA